MKLGLVGLASAATAGLLTLMVTWWFSPLDTVNAQVFQAFDTRGVTPIGYAVFAFALGVTAGVLIRRSLPAVATTLVAYVVVRLAVREWVRPYLLPPLHAVEPLTTAGGVGLSLSPSGLSLAVSGGNIRNAWVISSAAVDASGHVPTSQYLAKACPNVGPPGGLRSGGSIGFSGGHGPVPAPGQAFQSCIDNVATKFHLLVTYQPASRYWALQGLETTLYVVLALALVGICFWWVRHRLS